MYSYFTAAPVVAGTAVETPAAPGVKIHHTIAVRLGGKEGSGISHIVNDRGEAAVGNKFMKTQID